RAAPRTASSSARCGDACCRRVPDRDLRLRRRVWPVRPPYVKMMRMATTEHPQTPGRRPHKWWSLPKLPPPINPALLEQEPERAAARQNRVADAITAFSGSMLFVYVHIIWFACWIGFGVEDYPYGLLTMIVSLEAIFLSTFVLISQNRADAKRQVIANQQWQT